MTIAVGQFSAPSFGTAATNTTAGINTSASGSSFFIFIVYIATSAAVGDNKSNTYSQVGSTLLNFVGAGVNAAIFQVTNGTGGSGHTATVTLTAGAASEIYLLEVTGGATASLVDAISSAFWNDDASSPYTSNNVSTANAIDLLVAFTATATSAGTEVLTWGNSFTQVVSEANAANFTSAIAQNLVSSTGTYNSTFTATGAGTSEAATAVVALKNAAAAPLTSVAWIRA